MFSILRGTPAVRQASAARVRSSLSLGGNGNSSSNNTNSNSNNTNPVIARGYNARGGNTISNINSITLKQESSVFKHSAVVKNNLIHNVVRPTTLVSKVHAYSTKVMPASTATSILGRPLTVQKPADSTSLAATRLESSFNRGDHSNNNNSGNGNSNSGNNNNHSNNYNNNNRSDGGNNYRNNRNRGEGGNNYRNNNQKDMQGGNRGQNQGNKGNFRKNNNNNNESTRFGQIVFPGVLRKHINAVFANTSKPLSPQVMFYALMNCQSKTLKCSPAGRAQLAEHIWNTAIARGDFQPKNEHYRALLRGYLMNRQQFEVTNLWKDMHTRGVEPDLSVKQLFCDAYARAGDIKGFMNVFNSLSIEDRLAKNQYAYQTLAMARASIGDIGGPVKMLQELRSMGISPSESTYEEAMIICSKFGSSEQALEVISLMNQDNIEANSRIYNFLVTTFAHEGNLTYVQEAMEARQQRGWTKRPQSEFEQKFFSAVFVGDIDHAAELLTAARQEGIEPHAFVMADLMRAMYERGDGVRAYKFYRFAINNNIEVRPALKELCVGAQAKLQSHKAIKTVMNMRKQEDWLRDIAVYNAAMSSLIGADVDHETVETGMREVSDMIRFDRIKHMRETYLTRLKVWATPAPSRTVNMDKMNEVLQHMQDGGFPQGADTWTIKAQAAAHAQKEPVTKVLRTIAQMKEAGYENNMDCLCALVQAHCNEGNLEGAEQVIQLARDDADFYEGNSNLYIPIINMLCKEDISKALAYIRSLAEKDVPVRSVMYKGIFEHAATLNDPSVVFSIATELRQQGCDINHVVSVPLLKALARAGDVDGIISTLNSLPSETLVGHIGDEIVQNLPHSVDLLHIKQILEVLYDKHITLSHAVWSDIVSSRGINDETAGMADIIRLVSDNSDRTSMRPIIDGCVASGDVESAIATLDSLKGSPLFAANRNHFIRAYAALDDSTFESMKGVVERLVAANLGDATDLYSVLFRGFLAKLDGKMSEVIKVLEYLSELKEIENVKGLNLDHIIVLVRNGQKKSETENNTLDHSFRILKIMSDYGFEVKTGWVHESPSMNTVYEAVKKQYGAEEIAEGFFKECKTYDFKPSEGMLREVARVAINRGQYSAAKQLIDHVTESNKELERLLYLYVSRTADIEGGLAMLARINGSLTGATPLGASDPRVFLLHALGRAKGINAKKTSLRRAVDANLISFSGNESLGSFLGDALNDTVVADFVVKEIGGIEAIENSALGERILSHYRSTTQVTEARKLFSHLVEKNLITPDALITMASIESARANADRVIALLNLIESKNIALTNADKSRFAQKLLELSKKGNPIPEQAMKFIDAIQEPSLQLKNGLINYYCKINDTDTAEKLYNTLIESTAPQDMSLNPLIAAFVKQGNMEKVLFYESEMKKHNVYNSIPDFTMNLMLLAHANAGNEKKVEEIYKKLVENKYALSMRTVQGLVDMYSKLGNQELVTYFLKEAGNVSDFKSSKRILHDALENYVTSDDTDTAHQLLSQLGGKFFKNYHYLASVYAAKGDLNKTEEVVELAKENMPDIASTQLDELNLLRIEAYAKSNLEDANVQNVLRSFSETPSEDLKADMLKKWEAADRNPETFRQALENSFTN